MGSGLNFSVVREEGERSLPSSGPMEGGHRLGTSGSHVSKYLLTQTLFHEWAAGAVLKAIWQKPN